MAPVPDDLLQALRSITREYMKLRARQHCRTLESTRDIVCVSEALAQLKKYQYKADRPL